MGGNGSEGKRSEDTEAQVPAPQSASFPAELLSELLNAEDLSKKDPESVERIVARIAEFYLGPLPSPKTLAGYAEVFPEGPEIIFRGFKEEGEHRREMQRRELAAETRLGYLRTICATLVFLSIVALAGYAVSRDYSIEGTVTGLGSLTALVGVYMYGIKHRK